MGSRGLGVRGPAIEGLRGCVAASGPASAAAHSPGTCSSRLPEEASASPGTRRCAGTGTTFPRRRGSRVTAKGPGRRRFSGGWGRFWVSGASSGPSAIPARQPAANESGPGGARAQLGGCAGLLRRPRQHRLQEGTGRRLGGGCRGREPSSPPGGGTAVTRQRRQGAGRCLGAPPWARTPVPRDLEARRPAPLARPEDWPPPRWTSRVRSSRALHRPGRDGLGGPGAGDSQPRPPSLGAASETRQTRFRSLALLVEAPNRSLLEATFCGPFVCPAGLDREQVSIEEKRKTSELRVMFCLASSCGLERERASPGALRDCSREVREEPGYIEVFCWKHKTPKHVVEHQKITGNHTQETDISS